MRKEGRVAVFFGDVEAIQGDLNLVADKVSVYYRGKTGAVEDDGGLGGTVSRIDARDNVLLTSRGDTVKGQWAVYDVSRKIVTLGGNVELRQGDTLVKGDRLELDLESGKSRIQGLDSSGGEQRVRGEFTPATSDSSGN